VSFHVNRSVFDKTGYPTSSRYGIEVPKTLKLLSYNIQAGIGTSSYHHYVTRSWRHVLPEWRGIQRLDEIANVLMEYDLVALQEVDGGSLRSSFINQVAYLADTAEFDYWYQQLNRDFGRFGQFSNGVLSRFVPYELQDHKLPGIKGRGAIVAKYGSPAEPLVLVCVHLALSAKARYRQLDYIRELIQGHQHVIVMGDMNCRGDQIMNTPLSDTDLVLVQGSHPTYPSWKPERHIDHIMVSPSLKIQEVTVLDCRCSDHRPISMEVVLPTAVRDAFYNQLKTQ